MTGRPLRGNGAGVAGDVRGLQWTNGLFSRTAGRRHDHEEEPGRLRALCWERRGRPRRDALQKWVWPVRQGTQCSQPPRHQAEWLASHLAAHVGSHKGGLTGGRSEGWTRPTPRREVQTHGRQPRAGVGAEQSQAARGEEPGSDPRGTSRTWRPDPRHSAHRLVGPFSRTSPPGAETAHIE